MVRVLRQIEEGARRVLSAVEARPLVTARVIAESEGRDYSGVSRWLRVLHSEGLVESVSLGCTNPLSEYHYLSEIGQEYLGVAGSTRHQPANLILLLDRLTSVEGLYPAAASVKALGRMMEFQWLDGVSFDAAVRYEYGWVALFRAGLLRTEARLTELLEQFGNDLYALAVGDPSPRPSQLLFVAVDRWEGELILRVAHRFGMEDWVRVWCVSDDSWHGAAELQSSRGWVYQPVYRRSAGRRAWERRVKASLFSEPGAQEAALVLAAVTQWPGITIRILCAIDQKESAATLVPRTCGRLMDRGVVERELDGNQYRYKLTPAGMTLQAHLDRASAELAWRRIQMARWYMTQEELAREKIVRFRPHEFGLLDVMSDFISAHLPTAAGWRDSENLGADGGIAPDGLVYLNESPYGAGWHYVEYERSARAPTTVARKLRGYDSGLRDQQLAGSGGLL